MTRGTCTIMFRSTCAAGQLVKRIVFCKLGVLIHGPIRSGELVRRVLRKCSAVSRDSIWGLHAICTPNAPHISPKVSLCSLAMYVMTSGCAQPLLDVQRIRHHSAPRLIRWMARTRDNMFPARLLHAYQLRITPEISEHAA